MKPCCCVTSVSFCCSFVDVDDALPSEENKFHYKMKFIKFDYYICHFRRSHKSTLSGKQAAAAAADASAKQQWKIKFAF